MGEFFVYSVFAGTLFLFMPVFLYVDSYVDAFFNRAWFSVSLYRVFRVIGGYGQLDREGVGIHITRKKAFFLPYEKMADTRKKFEITKGFQLYTFRQTVETGGAQRMYGLMLAAGLQAVGSAVFSVLGWGKPFLSLRSSTVLSETPCLKLTTRTVFVFNGIVLSLALTKKALEAFLTWIRSKRSTIFSKRQPSN